MFFPFPPVRKSALVFAAVASLFVINALAADVIISEILASNTSGITDEDGDDSDWIELSNVSTAAVNLGGWYLTDKAGQLEKWAFSPNIILNAGAELVVYASSKNRSVTGAQLHTNWKLEGGVEFTFLAGTIIEANRSLYVSPNVADFRARAASPKGGQSLNVEGDYGGQISARGEMIVLVNTAAVTVATLNTASMPSVQQNALMMRELHYAPSGGKSFEFIELMKYALGLNPKIKTQDGLPAASLSGGSVRLEFQRLQKAPDVTLIVEISTDLIEWEPFAIEISNLDNNDGTEDVVFQSTLPVNSEPKQFLRLKVVQE